MLCQVAFSFVCCAVYSFATSRFFLKSSQGCSAATFADSFHWNQSRQSLDSVYRGRAASGIQSAAGQGRKYASRSKRRLRGRVTTDWKESKRRISVKQNFLSGMI